MKILTIDEACEKLRGMCHHERIRVRVMPGDHSPESEHEEFLVDWPCKWLAPKDDPQDAGADDGGAVDRCSCGGDVSKCMFGVAVMDNTVRAQGETIADLQSDNAVLNEKVWKLEGENARLTEVEQYHAHRGLFDEALEAQFEKLQAILGGDEQAARKWCWDQCELSKPDMPCGPEIVGDDDPCFMRNYWKTRAPDPQDPEALKGCEGTP